MDALRVQHNCVCFRNIEDVCLLFHPVLYGILCELELKVELVCRNESVFIP